VQDGEQGRGIGRGLSAQGETGGGQVHHGKKN
jgi:hypothetical protein